MNETSDITSFHHSFLHLLAFIHLAVPDCSLGQDSVLTSSTPIILVYLIFIPAADKQWKTLLKQNENGRRPLSF